MLQPVEKVGSTAFESAQLHSTYQCYNIKSNTNPIMDQEHFPINILCFSPDQELAIIHELFAEAKREWLASAEDILNSSSKHFLHQFSKAFHHKLVDPNEQYYMQQKRKICDKSSLHKGLMNDMQNKIQLRIGSYIGNTHRRKNEETTADRIQKIVVESLKNYFQSSVDLLDMSTAGSSQCSFEEKIEAFKAQYDKMKEHYEKVKHIVTYDREKKAEELDDHDYGRKKKGKEEKSGYRNSEYGYPSSSGYNKVVEKRLSNQWNSSGSKKPIYVQKVESKSVVPSAQPQYRQKPKDPPTEENKVQQEKGQSDTIVKNKKIRIIDQQTILGNGQGNLQWKMSGLKRQLQNLKSEHVALREKFFKTYPDRVIFKDNQKQLRVIPQYGQVEEKKNQIVRKQGEIKQLEKQIQQSQFNITRTQVALPQPREAQQSISIYKSFSGQPTRSYHLKQSAEQGSIGQEGAANDPTRTVQIKPSMNQPSGTLLPKTHTSDSTQQFGTPDSNHKQTHGTPQYLPLRGSQEPAIGKTFHQQPAYSKESKEQVYGSQKQSKISDLQSSIDSKNRRIQANKDLAQKYRQSSYVKYRQQQNIRLGQEVSVLQKQLDSMKRPAQDRKQGKFSSAYTSSSISRTTYIRFKDIQTSTLNQASLLVISQSPYLGGIPKPYRFP